MCCLKPVLPPRQAGNEGFAPLEEAVRDDIFPTGYIVRQLRSLTGFTYLTLLFVITVLGIASAVAGQAWSTLAAREREEELIFRGRQIGQAIGRYYEESPGAKAYPRSLEDMLKDPRYPVAKRHLRKIYVDPFTGKADWETIKAVDQGIMGVKSRSAKTPFKTGNFPKALSQLNGKTKYSEWEFVYVPTPPPASQS